MSARLCLVCGMSENEVQRMHYFPSRLKRSKVWQDNMGMVYTGCTLSGKLICCRHFTDENYLSQARDRLRRYAAPTLFPSMLTSISDGTDSTVGQAIGRVLPSSSESQDVGTRDQNSIAPTLDKGADLENCRQTDYNSISPVQHEVVDLENCTGQGLLQTSVLPVGDKDCNVVKGLPDEKPYFKSLKSYLKDDYIITEMCRICFRSLSDEEVIKLYDDSSNQDPEQIKNFIKLVLPDLDFEIYANIVICVHCAELLMYSYQLREKWLSTEEKLLKLIGEKKGVIDRNADLVLIGKRVEKRSASESDHASGVNPPCEKTQRSASVVNPPCEKPQRNASETGPASVVNPPCEKPQRSASETDHASVVNPPCEKPPPPPPLDFANDALLENVSSESQATLSNPVSLESFSTSERPETVKDAGLGPHICELCGRMYPNKKAFQSHSKYHKRSAKIVKRERTLLCETCGKTFKNLHGLKKHKKGIENVQHKCKFCGLAFQNSVRLRRHIASKHLPNRHQCHLCGKRFNDRKCLTVHLKCHNPDNKTQACQLCDRKFIYACDLRKHQSSHVKERSLKCDHCGKFLKHKWSLKKHIQIKHLKQGTLTCEFCDKIYWKRCDLRRHRLQVHGASEAPNEERQISTGEALK